MQVDKSMAWAGADALISIIAANRVAGNTFMSWMSDASAEGPGETETFLQRRDLGRHRVYPFEMIYSGDFSNETEYMYLVTDF